MLGDTSILGEKPQHFLDTGEFAFAIRRLPRRRIQVGLKPNGLIVSPLTRIENGHEIDVPVTNPLWFQVEGRDGAVLRVLTLGGNEHKEWDIPEKELILRLIDGSAFQIAEPSYSARDKFIHRNLAPRVQIEYRVEVYGAENLIQLPFVMGVMGDLSGKAVEPLPPVSERKFIEIDIDNFDECLKAIHPRVAFQLPDTSSGEDNLSVELRFENMDDFSPAAVARQVSALNQLLLERTQLSNLMTYIDGKAGAEDLIAMALKDKNLLKDLASAPKPDDVDGAGSEGGYQEAKINIEGQAKVDGKAHKVDDFMSLLNKELRPKSEQSREMMKQAVQTLAEQFLSSSITFSGDIPRTIQVMIWAIDNRLTEKLNPILHHPDFQQLEGTWRGLYYLVNNTETDEMLKIRFMNISKKELHGTLQKYKGSAWDQSPIFKKLYEEEYSQFGGEPYGCVIGDYYFDHSPQDVDLLGEIAMIAAAMHAPFLSSASPSVMQMESWQELGNPRDLTKIFQTPDYAAWRSLRESEDSRYIGLTMPRFLSRLPYGAKSDPVEEFDFEEDTGSGDSSKYTWANSAYAMAVNINRAFKQYGWCARIRGVEGGGAVEGLPTHIFPTDDGGVDMKCPTEIGISDRLETMLAKNGFMPLIHRKNSDFAAFIAAQTLQEPAEYEDPDAALNANLAARLPYLFATCRFAHYLKCIVRDKIGSFKWRDDMQRYLQGWIMQYVDGDPQNSSEETKARKPLAAAEVIVEDVEANPGYYISKIFLRPHYQLEGLTVSLRLVTKLPSAKA
jgi:type VI secretion system protein ImpC